MNAGVTFLTDGVHLVQVGGDVDDLHAFARQIGMRRRWFQDHRIPHYDLMGPFLAKAVGCGAMLVTSRVLVSLAGVYREREARARGAVLRLDETAEDLAP